jgi:hypothetical protein
MEETNPTNLIEEELDEETRIILKKPVNSETGFELKTTNERGKGRKKRIKENTNEEVIEMEIKKSGKKRCFNPRPLPLNWGKSEVKVENSGNPSLLEQPVKINQDLAKKFWSKILE